MGDSGEGDHTFQQDHCDYALSTRQSPDWGKREKKPKSRPNPGQTLKKNGRAATEMGGLLSASVRERSNPLKGKKSSQ